MGAERSSAYEFGSFRLEVSERRLLRDRQPLAVTPKQFDLLQLLVENSGRLLEKSELMNRLWPGVYVDEGNLTRNISDLRKVLGDDGNGHGCIETVPKRGYRFVAEVRTPALEAVAEARPAPSRKGLLLALCTALVVLLAAIAWWSFRTSPVAAVHSVAVLPFRSVQSRDSETFLELGLADALITRLGTLSEVAIRPVRAIQSYGNSTDPIAAGKQLRVDAVLEGSLQQTNGTFRVSARLLWVADGRTLWAGTFDEKAADLLQLEDVLSDRVAMALLPRLSGPERALVSRRHTNNPEAYRLYLRGRYFWNRRTMEGNQKAIESFQRAVNADPSFALAHAGLADGFVFSSQYEAAHLQAYENGRAAAKRALEIDPSLAEPHATLGLIAWNYGLDWAEAEREFRASVKLNPNYPTAHHWYGEFLSHMSRFDEAVAEMRRALELDPLSPIITANMGTVYYWARDDDRTIEWCRKALDLDPNFPVASHWLASGYYAKGWYEKALNELEKARGVSANWSDLSIISLHIKLGKVAQARSELRKVEQSAGAEYFSTNDIALVYLLLGEKDHALDLLERAYQERAVGLSTLKVSRGFDSVRGHPRFQALMTKLRL